MHYTRKNTNLNNIRIKIQKIQKLRQVAIKTKKQYHDRRKLLGRCPPAVHFEFSDRYQISSPPPQSRTSEVVGHARHSRYKLRRQTQHTKCRNIGDPNNVRHQRHNGITQGAYHDDFKQTWVDGTARPSHYLP